MKHSLLHFATVLLIASVTLLHTSCKEDTIIRAKAAPNVAGIDVIAIPDTLTLISKTTYVDTYNSSKSPLYINALGCVVDGFSGTGLFGKTSAGLVMQVEPAVAQFSIADDHSTYTIDSAFVLVPAVLNGVRWGDTANAGDQKQSFTVYELNEDLSVDSNYYSYRKPNVKPTPISNSYSRDFKTLGDSVTVQGINYPAHLRIPLNSNFINYFNSTVLTSTNTATTASFLSAFKGLYIAPDTNNPKKILGYFGLTGAADYSRASMVFYYHLNSAPTAAVTAFFNFVTTDCARYNYISRNDPKIRAAVTASLAHPDVADPQVYIEGRPGAEIDIRVPNIKNLPLGVINKAQLTFTQLQITNPQYDSTLFLPPRIDPYRVNLDGSLSYVADWQVTGTTTTSTDAVNFTDGTPTLIILGGGILVYTYHINIPREVQMAIVGKWDQLHLRLRIPEGYPAAYQLAAGGRGNLISNMSFQIFYSKPQ